MAISLDIGTMFLVKGELDVATDEPEFTVERNCFLQSATTEDTEDTLTENNWAYAKHGEDYYILGEDAIKLKNLLTIGSNDQSIVSTKVGELRRPMKDGILNTGEEKLSVAIIQKLIENLLGAPAHPEEVLCFCAPGDPVDRKLTVVFHRTMLTNFLKSLGYKVECIPEALAVVFSQRPVAADPSEEGGEAPFSGIAFSFGAGMANICLRGNTKIPLLDGSEKTIAELATEYNDKEFWVYSCRKDGQIVPGKAKLPRLTKSNASLVRVHIDDGTYFDCTPDHLIMLRNGEYKKAEDLSENESLMPLYRQKYSFPNSRNKYEKVKNNRTGRWNATHRLVAAQHANCQLKQREVVHHKDFNSLNNVPENLDIMENSAHSKLHQILANYSREKLAGKTLEEIFGDPEIARKIGEKRADGIRLALKDPKKRQRMIQGLVQYNKQWKGKTYDDKYGSKSSQVKEKLSQSHRDKKLSEETKKNISSAGMDKYGKYYKEGFKNQYSNHKVVKVEFLKERDDVYDITVDQYSNFAIANGIFVHNCFAWKKMPLINFSIAQSGDWIDQESANVAGVDVSAITRYKETKFNLNEVDYSDMRQAGLDIFYQNMIEHALNNFAEKFNQLDSQIDTPLEIVIAGGTASVPGFLEKFQSVASGLELPFEVKSIRMAENPFYAVSHGCLVKAMATENKAKAGTQPETPKEQLPKKVKLQ